MPRENVQAGNDFTDAAAFEQGDDMPKAAVVYAFDKPMKIEEVTYRELRADELRVKIAACGVCHSDLSVLNMIIPCPTPVILGHEAAGVVTEIGPGVTEFKTGDRVVASWKPSCGECRYCKRGQGHLCHLGDNPSATAGDRATIDGKPVLEFLGIGGFADETILATNAAVKIDDSIPMEKAALLGCAVITGYGAAKNAGGVSPGDEVAVFGCGGVGLNVIQGARNCGASLIVAVDRDDAHLEMAKKFGATHTFNVGEEKYLKKIMALTTGGQGVDHAFDAVGNAKVAEAAFRTLCKGGKAVLVGVPALAEKVSFPPFISSLFEKHFIGTVAGSKSPSEAVPEFVSLYHEGRLNLDDLVSRTYTLDQANDAMNDLREGKNARGVIVMA